MMNQLENKTKPREGKNMLWAFTQNNAQELQKELENMDKISFGKAIDGILRSTEDPIVFTNRKEDTMSWDFANRRISIKNADGEEYLEPLANDLVSDCWRLANIVSYTEAVQSGADIMWHDSPMDVDDRFLGFMEPEEFLFQISAFYSEKEVLDILRFHNFIFQGGI